MTSGEELVGEFATCRNATRRHQIIEELAGHLPDPVAYEFIVGVLEGTAPAATLDRITALRSLCLGRLDPPADRGRVARALARIARDSPSSEEQTFALAACRLLLDTPEVAGLLADLLVHRPAGRGMRLVAINQLAVLKPGGVPGYAVDLCRRLRDDPEVGGTASYLLARWRAGGR
jgi:hypothetical protein